MAKLSTNMDAEELMAYDLEYRQALRLRNTKFQSEFFTREAEVTIRKQIQELRKASKTYSPENAYQLNRTRSDNAKTLGGQ